MPNKGLKNTKQCTLFSERNYTEYNKSQSSYWTYSSKIEAMKEVIRKLRTEDLKQGHCFMIFDESLPEDHAFYEYPNGKICIEKLDKRNIKIPRVVIKVLNKTETKSVREKHAIS